MMQWLGPQNLTGAMRLARRRGLWWCGLLGVWTLPLLTLAAAPADEPGGVRPTTETESCATDQCHADIASRKVMHGPAAQDKCLACHQYVEPRQHQFTLAEESDKLCGSCHTLTHRTYAHTPVKQGRCTGCHDPHGSDHRMMLVDDPTRGLCMSCHRQDGLTDKAFVHGPVATGACILCHEPHSSWQPKLLTKPADEMCLDCHTEVAPDAAEARHVHAPIRDGCTTCHDSHASDHQYQLRQAAPELCFTCHAETKEALASAKVVHGAMTQAGGCLGCHTAHFSNLPKLQKHPQPAMCLSCHDRPLETADGEALTNMAQLLVDNPEHHGPIREGDCSTCHRAHAGDLPRLLTMAYPPEFYAPFEGERYALCFSCHIKDLVTAERGTGLTRFRKGDVNLHWLHVNREKGRTCRSCHEIHASRQPFHIRESVPFGDAGWMLEIRYQKTDTGGSCTPGCHRQASYEHGESDPAPSKTAAPSKGDAP